MNKRQRFKEPKSSENANYNAKRENITPVGTPKLLLFMEKGWDSNPLRVDVQLEEALFQGETIYISKVTKTAKEICSLVESAFEYVTEFEGSKIFRKHKL